MNTIYLALGSNIGDRYQYMQTSIALLSEHLQDIAQSSVYETRPWGLSTQNTFLNMVIQAQTELSPVELLAFTQSVQVVAGRKKTTFNGPRTIDIDIIFFNQENIQLPTLMIPHERMYERDFVLKPLSDIDSDFIHPSLSKTVGQLLAGVKEKHIIKKYIPTQIVGILNLSPESFSNDFHSDIPDILTRVSTMLEEGVDIIDIGAQSTKPGTPQISEEEELSRLEGVIPAIKARFPSVKLSLDTTRLACARLAIQQGVDMLNDISGARFAPDIIPLIINTPIKIVIMHSQGEFAQIHNTYSHKDMIAELLDYFTERIDVLRRIGLRKDQIIIDPGIGFSKGSDENFEIIKRLEELKQLGLPLYVGLSRKKFIGTTINKSNPSDLDIGSTVLHTVCMKKGIDYIRTHNVQYLKEARDILGCM